jgi:hypothetical protein
VGVWGRARWTKREVRADRACIKTYDVVSRSNLRRCELKINEELRERFACDSFPFEQRGKRRSLIGTSSAPTETTWRAIVFHGRDVLEFTYSGTMQ